MAINGYILECPKCGHRGDGSVFSPSCADECECPECGETFMFEYPEDEDDDEE